MAKIGILRAILTVMPLPYSKPAQKGVFLRPMESNVPHRAGFVNIIGRPNVGKSTLMNALVGERLSVISPKAQTTRHRILGMVNDKNYQLVFSDTPGIIREPQYGLHKAMNEFVRLSLEDADVLLFLTEIYEHPNQLEDVLQSLKGVEAKKLLLINKVDQAKDEKLAELTEAWQATGLFDKILPVSALASLGLNELMKQIVAHLPISPPYYPKDELTDRPERFFASEIIRGRIFANYTKEIPYCTEVIIESFKDDPDISRISATIFVERQSQKPIVIGKDGSKLKKVGTESRLELEEFLGRKVFLELYVKVKENWRNDPRLLKGLGYEN